MKPLSTLPIALLACVLPSLVPAPELPQEPGPRSGLIEIPAGRSLVGNAFEKVQKLAQSDVVNASLYVGELGRAEITVARFWIGPTPVTNEMYLAYVQDAGVIPPADWAQISSELRQELILAGKDIDDNGRPRNPGYKFDEVEQVRWWKENWQNEAYTWEMPPARALEPVVFVSYRDALGYCEWAGLRMPNEAEWTRAARGDTDYDFPWGPEFDATRVSFEKTEPKELAFKRLPVGLLDNASPYGVIDLVGNVWEFTEDRYRALDGASEVEDKVRITRDDGGSVVVYPSFETSRYVLKGGCYMLASELVRIDMRVGMDGDLPAEVLGFRVAASDNRLGDIASTRARRVSSQVLGGQPTRVLDFSRSIGVEKRSYPDMGAVRSARKPPEAPLGEPQLPDSYAVFGPVAAVVFTPVADPFADYDHASVSKIETAATADGKLPALGALCTTVPFLSGAGVGGADGEPIAAGDYALAYLPPLRSREIEEYGGYTEDTKPEERPEKAEKRLNVDISGIPVVADEAQVLVVDGDGKALLALPLVNLNNKIKVQADKNQDAAAAIDLQRNRLRIDMEFPGPGTKTYFLSIGLRPLSADGSFPLTGLSDWDPGTFEVVAKTR